jgi:hypothetical protein
LGLRGLNAYIGDCKQISHCLGFLHGDLLNYFKNDDPVVKGIDDLDDLDVRNGVPGIAETFHIVPETLIMLLLDGLQSFSCRWMLVCTLKIPDEHGTKLVPIVDGSFRQVDEPRPGRARQCHEQVIIFHPIISSRGLDDYVIDLEESFGIFGAMIYVDVPGLEVFWPHDLPE